MSDVLDGQFSQGRKMRALRLKGFIQCPGLSPRKLENPHFQDKTAQRELPSRRDKMLTIKTRANPRLLLAAWDREVQCNHSYKLLHELYSAESDPQPENSPSVHTKRYKLNLGLEQRGWMGKGKHRRPREAGTIKKRHTAE